MNFGSTVVFCSNEDVCHFRRFPRLMLKKGNRGWKMIQYHDMQSRKHGCSLISANFMSHELPQRLKDIQEVVEATGKTVETTVRYLDDK